MTITHSSKLVASVAGIAVAAALIAGAFAVQPAKAALSSSQVSAIISLLQSFGADSATIANVQASLTGGTPTSGGSSSTGGTGAACYTWTRDLQAGSTGADVTALQVFLNSNSATMVAASGAGSPGMETSTFGPATKAALMKFQTANAIAPAAGYFGPVTRAAVAAKCSGSTGGTPSTPSGPLQGGEGELQINDTLGDVESDIDEGASDEKVLGVEVEAQDSDVMIERVDVDVTLSGTGSSQLDNYIDSVSLWLDGKKLASQDVDEADEDNDVFSFRFTGLKGVVREDDQAQLYVSVDAVSNIDSGDSSKQIAVEIPEDGIRAVDGAGISDTYVSGSDNLEETGITIGESTGGDVEIKEGDNNPEGQVVTVDEDDDTNDVLVLAFDLEGNNQDVTIDRIPVSLSVGATNGVDGPVKRAILKRNGTTIDTKSIPASATSSYIVLFDDLNIDLGDNDTDEYEVFVDLNNTEVNGSNFATGTSLYAKTGTTTNGYWDIEDDNGDDVTPTGSVNNSGDLLIFQTDGISVKLVSVNETKTFAADVAPQADIAEFQVVVDITATGDDMYIDKSATRDDVTADGIGSAGNGFMWATTTESTTGTTSIAATVTASGSTSGDSSNNFKINDGQTRRFTLTVSLQAAANGVAAVKLTGINWAQTDSANLSTTFFNSNMSDFKTDLMTLIKL